MSKILKTRILQKYDTANNWGKQNPNTGVPIDEQFIPRDGEVVIYDKETAGSPGVKIGNGSTVLKELPFIASHEKVITKENVITFDEMRQILIKVCKNYKNITSMTPNLPDTEKFPVLPD